MLRIAMFNEEDGYSDEDSTIDGDDDMDHAQNQDFSTV